MPERVCGGFQGGTQLKEMIKLQEKMISVVIPTYKSEPNLPELVRRLTAVLSSCRTDTKSSLLTTTAPMIPAPC